MNNAILKPHLRILHLEDNLRDAELIREHLEAEGLDCEITLASDRQAFESALNQSVFDLILCDNSLPDYDGLAALAQARAKQPATPFIFISGTLGEEVAVECLKTGATDYVLKQRLPRLGPAVRRALADAAKAAELNRAEESMRESESKYRQLVESLSDAAFLADEATGRILDINAQAERLLGRSRGEILGTQIGGSHSPATAGAFRQWWLTMREQRHAPSQDGEIVRADGRVVPVHVTAAHMTFHQRPLILVLYRDITALKQIEARLLRLQSPDAEARASRPLRLLHLEDNPRDAELIRDRLEAGGLACEVTLVNGRQSFESALDQAVFDIILCDYKLPDYDGGAALAQARAKQPGVPVIIVSGTLGEEAAVDCLKNGATDYLLKQRIERLPAAVKRALDEAEEHRKRRQAEEKLQTSHQQLLNIIEFLPDATFVIDRDKKVIAWNRAIEEMTGTRKEDILGQGDYAYAIPWYGERRPVLIDLIGDDDSAFKTKYQYVKKQDRLLYAEVFIPSLFGGRGAHLWVTASPLLDSHSNIVGAIESVRDITERKKAEESHARLATAVEQSAESVTITDTNGKILYVNPAFEKTSGYSRPEAIGQNPRILKSGKQDAAFYRQMWDVLTRGEVWQGHFINQRKDGKLYEEEATISPIRDAEGKVVNYVAAKRDVTHEVQLEMQARQMQKMEAIGQLAGGVAHDFNNILEVIQIQSDLLKTSGNLSPAQFDFAKEIGAAVQRAAALTRQLLLFSRNEILQLHDLDLNQSLNNMSKMLQRILGENIQMQFKFAPQPLFIHADAGMMDQVLMNLAINSRDAMPEGGRLVIETATAEFDEAAVLQSPQVRIGSFICLSVSDTGCGIPAEVLPRIFEPFFTTKGVGKGTGLGLATVFGIVQQHQGWLHVYSEPGHGTTFRIYLPWLSGTTDQTIAQKMLAVPMRGGNETILLVEDDAFLRVSVCKALTQLGYRLLEAGNGAEALEVWRQHRAEINLMLTDLVMPGGMNGKELAERLLKENPQLKVIYASGYSAEVAAKNFPLEEGVNFLAKPFQTFKLAQTVRKNLDANSLFASPARFHQAPDQSGVPNPDAAQGTSASLPTKPVANPDRISAVAGFDIKHMG